MKKTLVLLTSIFLSAACIAQSKTSVMIQQIAANAAVMADIKKGISIAREGLDFIGKAKNGEFNLHQLFFGSLKSINPKIAGWARVADIITLQLQLIKNYKVHSKSIQDSNQFSASEINYLFSVFSKLTDQAAADLEALITILSANQYQMNDNERIKQIDLLYGEMQSNYDFEQHLSNGAMVLANQRKQESKEAANAMLLNGIK